MRKIRIAGVQGFYGDSPLGAMMVAMMGSADYLVQDALSELTLSILQKDKLKNPELGYARDIEIFASRVYPIALSKGMKIVINSGGLHPLAAAKRVSEICKEKGIHAKIAAITGDNLLPVMNELQEKYNFKNLDKEQYLHELPFEMTHANVYTGAQKIKESLDQGADIVITGRVADPCLTLGILAHEFQWNLTSPSEEEELDLLAKGILAGHLIECGAQVTGGNSYASWDGQNDDFATIGYPIAVFFEDGEFYLTKTEGTGGRVTRDTVREQLVYEIHDPSSYITPDVIVNLCGVEIIEEKENIVWLKGAKGSKRPDQLKLCIGLKEGYLSEHLFYFSYPNALQKVKSFEKAAKEIWQIMSFQPDEIRFQYLGLNGIHESAAPVYEDKVTETLNEIGLRIVIKHEKEDLGKKMIQSIVCLGLNGPPGIAASMNWGKNGSVRLGLFPTLIPREEVHETIHFL